MSWETFWNVGQGFVFAQHLPQGDAIIKLRHLAVDGSNDHERSTPVGGATRKMQNIQCDISKSRNIHEIKCDSKNHLKSIPACRAPLETRTTTSLRRSGVTAKTPRNVHCSARRAWSDHETDTPQPARSRGFFLIYAPDPLNQAFRARLPQRFTAPGWRLCYWLLLTAACCMSGQKFVYWKSSLDGVITWPHILAIVICFLTTLSTFSGNLWKEIKTMYVVVCSCWNHRKAPKLRLNHSKAYTKSWPWAKNLSVPKMKDIDTHQVSLFFSHYKHFTQYDSDLWHIRFVMTCVDECNMCGI